MTLSSLALAVAAFVAGYLTGRLDTLLGVLRGQTNNTPQGFFAKTGSQARGAAQAAAPDIAIDERKVVSQIKTDTFQKVTDIQLGKQVVATDDIGASVNKLAQLKGK